MSHPGYSERGKIHVKLGPYTVKIRYFSKHLRLHIPLSKGSRNVSATDKDTLSNDLQRAC